MKSLLKVLEAILLLDLFMPSIAFSMAPTIEYKDAPSLTTLSSDQIGKYIELGKIKISDLDKLQPELKELSLAKYFLKLSENNHEAACLRIIRDASITKELKNRLLKKLESLGASPKYAKGLQNWLILHGQGELNKGLAYLFFNQFSYDEERVQILLKAGANINGRIDHLGRTILMMMAFKDNTEKMRILIKLGADVNIKDYNGDTALVWAATNNKDSVAPVKLLIEECNIDSNSLPRVLEKAQNKPNRRITNYLKGKYSPGNVLPMQHKK